MACQRTSCISNPQLQHISRHWLLPSPLKTWSICPKWEHDWCDLIHMFWHCLEISYGYYIHSRCDYCPGRSCNLLAECDRWGIVSSSDLYHMTRLLFLAHKQIPSFWISPRIPTKQIWLEQGNSILIREKLTYQHKNALHKFYSIWQNWMDTPDLVPTQLILNQLL